MRVHFWNQHVRDTVLIMEEGNLPHPCYPLCDMMVLWKALNGTHRRTAQCTQGAERKRWGLLAEEEREVPARDFRAYGHPLEMATSFKYLGRVILATNDDWTAVVRNFPWAKTVWSRILRIISREGATPRVSGFFLKTVIQAVLIFKAETWVVTPRTGKDLGGGFRPRWRDGLRESSSGVQRTGRGDTPRWRRQGRWRGSRQWRNTSGSDRTRSHSILLRNHC